MGTILPGETLIYERAGGVVYARYQNKPEIPRWIIGGDPGAVAQSQGEILDYAEWKNLCDMCEKYVTLKRQMDKLVTTYYMIKDSK
jgi:hypothetical protein